VTTGTVARRMRHRALSEFRAYTGVSKAVAYICGRMSSSKCVREYLSWRTFPTPPSPTTTHLMVRPTVGIRLV
jgi:hypothetical protein